MFIHFISPPAHHKNTNWDFCFNEIMHWQSVTLIMSSLNILSLPLAMSWDPLWVFTEITKSLTASNTWEKNKRKPRLALFYMHIMTKFISSLYALCVRVTWTCVSMSSFQQVKRANSVFQEALNRFGQYAFTLHGVHCSMWPSICKALMQFCSVVLSMSSVATEWENTQILKVLFAKFSF